jgi:Flp pilus assembly secretin CpaC
MVKNECGYINKYHYLAFVVGLISLLIAIILVTGPRKRDNELTMENFQEYLFVRASANNSIETSNNITTYVARVIVGKLENIEMGFRDVEITVRFVVNGNVTSIDDVFTFKIYRLGNSNRQGSASRDVGNYQHSRSSVLPEATVEVLSISGRIVWRRVQWA